MMKFPYKFGKKEGKPGKKGKLAKRIIIGVLVLALIGAGAYYFMGKKKNQKIATVSTGIVTKGNIRVTVSGSGALEAIESYEVKSKVSGDVLSGNFKEGDKVKKDQVLYTIDSTEIKNTIERAELSMQKTRDSYNTTVKNTEKLTVKAPIQGTITEMYVSKGDSISAGTKICDITDSSRMVLTVPFNSADTGGIYEGAQAKIVLDNSFFETTGTVTRVASGSLSSDTNASITYVDIITDNPGGIKEGDTATAMVGEVACNSPGTFKTNGKKTVTAEVAGEVGTIYNDMGDYMYEGGVILVMESESISDSLKSAQNTLRDAELSLENTYDKLDDYTIKAPISGTVIYKNVKAGDTLDNTTGAATLCYIADMSSIVFTLSVDELDINKIKAGQKVEITADAVEGLYMGKVTKVSINGTTANGVTTYPVEITLDDPGSLIPGMNVNADIIIEEKKDTLMVPVSAIVRGGMCYVKDNAPAKKEDKKKDKKENGANSKMPFNMVPEGFKAVKVETGVNNDDFIEIISGLKEGDEVYVKSVSANTGTGFPGMPGMGGGMPGGMGGGMPSGGMGGGMRSGGGMPSGGMSGGMSSGGMRSGGGMPSGGGMR